MLRTNTTPPRRHPVKQRRFARRGVVASTLLLAASIGLVSVGSTVASAAAASGDNAIYWVNEATPSIARANLDSSGVNQSFIPSSDLSDNPDWVAVDGNHLYWTNFADPVLGGTIGRSNLDGTDPDQDFITVGFTPSEQSENPQGVAVDGDFIYWANRSGGSIGRADLDGTNVDDNFITGLSLPVSVAVDGNFVYWTANGTIGRANLNGTSPNPAFIPLSIQDVISGVAVDGTHLYWTDESTGNIGRASLDGQTLDPTFITGTQAADVAVDGTSIYWTNFSSGTIGRADLDGLNVNESYISGGLQPNGIALGPSANVPTVTGISPTSGSMDGGNTVTVTGTFLTGATSVSFGSTAVSSGITVAGDGNSLTVTAPPGTVGPVDVTVTTSDDTSATSASDAYTYDAVAPAAPTDLTAAPGTNDIALNWTAPTDNGGAAITGYQVLRGTTARGESATPIATVTSGTSYTDTSAVPGTAHFYTVEAVNSAGNSTASNEATATVAVVPVVTTPAAPTDLAAAAGANDIALNWTASTDNGGAAVTGYQVFRGTTTGGESATPIATVTSGTSYTDPDVTPGTAYFYTVEAVNSVGNSVTSHEATATVAVTRSTGGMLAVTPGSQGYWLVSPTGVVTAHGDAVNYGSLSGVPLNAPVVGITATPDGKGYWLVASDGGVFAFGDANFYGSTGNLRLNQPIVGLTATPDGQGYWLVAADGGVFTFGDAVYHGSTGDLQLNKPIIGMAATPDGQGYWLVASDGGVFTFGDAAYYGSTSGQTADQPTVGLLTNAGGQGYTLVGASGTATSFGVTG
jgi:Fibronectin type III domain/IPT/TIG domain